MNLEEMQRKLERLPVGDLRAEYQKIVGHPSRSRNRTYLVRRILWYAQAKECGDISEESRMLVRQIADLRDIYHRIPTKLDVVENSTTSRRYSRANSTKKDRRIPIPGTVLVRKYKGQDIRVNILPDGFEWSGRKFKSLSAVAQAVTGTHWNGYGFFGLLKK
ncbi:MAG: DUF2924 domain-containing protein [Allomuricauda sp.]